MVCTISESGQPPALRRSARMRSGAKPNSPCSSAGPPRSAASGRPAKRRYGADLGENVEGVELVPVLDEASVLHPPDIDRAHGEGSTRRGIAEEVPGVR